MTVELFGGFKTFILKNKTPPTGIDTKMNILPAILETFDQAYQREHVERMRQIDLIENSSMRDQFAQILLIDIVLRPIEKVYQKIQDTAKELQKRAEKVVTYRDYYELNNSYADIIATELRELACRVAAINSFSDLKNTYRIISNYLSEVSLKKSQRWHEEIVYNIRKNVLEPLSDSIAETNKFEMSQNYAARLKLISGEQNGYLN